MLFTIRGLTFCGLFLFLSVRNTGKIDIFHIFFFFFVKRRGNSLKHAIANVFHYSTMNESA